MPADLIQISQRYKTRSETVFRDRRLKNEENWWAYLGEQNFSEKAEWQNQETTPGFPIAIEHIVGTLERALTDSDDWLRVQPAGVGKPFLKSEIIAKLLQFYLGRLHQPGNRMETGYGIQVFVSDAMKRALLEPVVIAKVYPVLKKKRLFQFETAQPVGRDTGTYFPHEMATNPDTPIDIPVMRLAVELVDYDDYLPDPSEARRYEIHRTRRNLYDLRANPEYDQHAVDSLLGKANEEYDQINKIKNRDQQKVPRDPYEVDVFEAWGDVVDHTTGEILHENVFWAWSNDKILREPTPNPFWDGASPFVVAPLIRVPKTVTGKAMADHAVPMWRVVNELVNLHLDAAARGAWGVGQVRTDIMENPEDIADGVPNGYSAVLKPNAPAGLRFYERVDDGAASNVTLDGIQKVDGYLKESLATPDTRLGQLPQRATKATEIVQAMQSAGSLYESLAARIEDTFLEPIFDKGWRLILQYSPDFLEDEIVQILGPSNAILINNPELTVQERFRLLASAQTRVRGLRGVATRERFFQKIMTLVNLLASNPQFAEHYTRTRDLAKLWDQVDRAIGIDPDMLKTDPLEREEGDGLDPAIPGGSGASAPNLTGQRAQTPQAQAGQGAGVAATNPANNLAQ